MIESIVVDNIHKRDLVGNEYFSKKTFVNTKIIALIGVITFERFGKKKKKTFER